MDRAIKITAVILTLVFSIFSFQVSAENKDIPSAQSLGMQELKDDLSRQELFEEVINSDSASKKAHKSFVLENRFTFPGDAQKERATGNDRLNSIFGVDISHHNDTDFPIEQLNAFQAEFIYIKSTQGVTRVDPMFGVFWKRAGAIEKGVKLHRGAYHFLSSGNTSDDPREFGKAQAKSLVKVIKANGGLKPTDMPPSVDVEWDKADEKAPDRWKNRKPDEIISMVKAFSDQIEKDLGIKPIIYTAKSWWLERVGSEARMSEFSGNKLWIADYSKSSQADETPKTINSKPWLIWQFTESARLNIGYDKNLDASIYKGERDSFYSSMGVQRF